MRTTNRFFEVKDAWNIVGRDCGRNQYEEFRCVCGKCTPLREQREGDLMAALTPDGLKKIGEDIAEVIRRHKLQHSPELCRKLLSYLADVIDGWNSV